MPINKMYYLINYYLCLTLLEYFLLEKSIQEILLFD
nr:MAG TPA: hypothetical protein [Bacteriophage sp.]